MTIEARQPMRIAGHFLMGNVHDFNHNTLQFMLDARQWGDMAVMYYTLFPLYIANHPDVVHDIFVTQANAFNKSLQTKIALKPVVGNGLFTNDGEDWRQQRKLAQPSFHTKRIQAYADVMVRYTEEVRQRIAPNQPIDIEREMAHLTMKIVGKTLFDYEEGADDRMSEAVRVALRHVDVRFSRLVQLPDWLPTRENREFKQATDYLDLFIQQIVDQRRNSNEDNGDLLSMLMMAHDDETNTRMSDKQLRDEAMTIYGAGHETTSGTLTWTWYLLSQHPAIASKLHEELDRVLGGRLPTFADLPALPYTEMVIKESMRLYPPAWATSRQTNQDVTVTGYPLKKDSIVLVNIYGMHRDERWFPNPDVFDPERFSPENEASINKRAYVPFGAGPRVCIGNSFAMMEARLLLATLAQQWHFDLAPDQHVEPARQFTLRPRYGMKMIARQRVLETERT